MHRPGTAAGGKVHAWWCDSRFNNDSLGYRTCAISSKGQYTHPTDEDRGRAASSPAPFSLNQQLSIGQERHKPGPSRQGMESATSGRFSAVRCIPNDVKGSPVAAPTDADGGHTTPLQSASGRRATPCAAGDLKSP